MVDIAEGPVETKQCPLCEKWIDISKFRMHEIGCMRANYKCKVCGMCVPKDEKEEHEEEWHSIVKCIHCNYEAMKFIFKDHEEKCEFKPRKCPYCEVMIKFSEFEDHLNMCGIKTYKCGICGEWVKNMDKATHTSSG